MCIMQTAPDEIAFAGAIQSEQTLVTFARLPFTGRVQILAFPQRVNLPTGIRAIVPPQPEFC
jgi:hypothetical protein